MIARAMTVGPKHHFFGFHDLPITSTASGRWLGLAVDRIDRPPMGDDRAEVIVWEDGADFSPRLLTATRTFNFPQGARQHWLGETDTVIVNGEDAAGRPIATLHDASDGTLLGQISAGSYCSDATGRRSFGLDFGRLHRLGGYGHATISDRTPEAVSPADNGLFVTEIAADRTDLLLSIDDVRRAAGAATATGGHFLTHLRLSPDGRRIAFLHRYRLPDGGEETCLFTVGTDGSGLRLLLRGFLSHFDWIYPTTLIIWGRGNQAIAAMRRHPLLSNPVARALLPLVKAPLRALMGRSKAAVQSYLAVADADGADPQPFAPDQLSADGHPMRNPARPGVLVTDTYPDASGTRDLMLFHVAEGARTDLGRFRKADATPSESVVQQVAAHLRDSVSVRIAPDLYAFTRSGLHCDLHPRWTADGRSVAFDSIHEGTRQIYAMTVAEFL